MSATIQINACDNELYLIAYHPDASYQLAHIQSGHFNSVKVEITVSKGTYIEPKTLQGILPNTQINNSYTVNIPDGNYTLIAVGIDWGTGPWGFALTLNNKNITGNGNASGGVIWTPPGVQFTI